MLYNLKLTLLAIAEKFCRQARVLAFPLSTPTSSTYVLLLLDPQNFKLTCEYQTEFNIFKKQINSKIKI